MEFRFFIEEQEQQQQKKNLMTLEEEWIEPEGTVLCKRTQTCKKTYVSSHMLSPNLKYVLVAIRESR